MKSKQPDVLVRFCEIVSYSFENELSCWNAGNLEPNVWNWKPTVSLLSIQWCSARTRRVGTL